MTPVLKLSGRDLDGVELLSLLVELELLPLLIRRYIERSSSSHIIPTEADQLAFQSTFLASNNIIDLDGLNQWLVKNDISEPQLSKQIYHTLQIAQFKSSKYSSLVQSTFLNLKDSLDKVMYSLIRTKSSSKAFELYTRLTEEEATFADLASQYSEGSESQVNGLIGPIELGRLNLSIAERLRMSKQGQMWEPFEEEGWWVLLRLEKYLPSQLDDSMTERIINDLHSNWLHQNVKKELVSVINNNPSISKSLDYLPLTSNIDSSEETQKSSFFRKILNKISNK